MKIFPAIDLYEGKAVRLYKGDYSHMTIYSDNPIDVACVFQKKGAENVHIVDLQGAKNGDTPNIKIIKDIINASNMFVEVGGGIRSMDVISRYIQAGVGRIILGTAAVTNEKLVSDSILRYGDSIAVGADIRDGKIAIKGWTEKSEISCDSFLTKMQNLGVKTVICTDISKDGAMQGTNRELYKSLSEKFDINIIASGGVSTIEDVRALRKLNIYGAIIGKAYYTGNIDISEAIEVAR